MNNKKRKKTKCELKAESFGQLATRPSKVKGQNLAVDVDRINILATHLSNYLL